MLAVSRKSFFARLPVTTLAVGALLLGACAREETATSRAPVESEPTGFSSNPYCTEDVVLCSTLPGTEIEVPPGCESFDQQCARNFWSWQNFVSLNWPGEIVPDGDTQKVIPDPDASIGSGGNRVWELWMDPDSVFLPNAVQPQWTPGETHSPYCDDTGEKTLTGRSAKASVSFDDLDPNSFFEATIQQPLIDQAMNFVVFEIRMNQQEVEWVVDHTLYQEEVVQGLTTNLTLPPDAIEVKAAWRILPPDMEEAQKDRYYRHAARIVLDPENVEGGGSQPVCLTRELGMIGLHIRHNGLWSTFEQVDNLTAPSGMQPTLFDPSCTDCTVNVPPTDPEGKKIRPAQYQWNPDPSQPSASLYTGFPNVPAQIARGAGQEQWIDQAMNEWWQTSVLEGTPFQYYMLITTNWIEEQNSQPIPTLNTTLEPYIPPHADLPQACISCHELATNDHGAEIAQTFLPFRACPKNPRPGETLPPNCVPSQIDTLARSPD